MENKDILRIERTANTIYRSRMYWFYTFCVLLAGLIVYVAFDPSNNLRIIVGMIGGSSLMFAILHMCGVNEDAIPSPWQERKTRLGLLKQAKVENWDLQKYELLLGIYW